MLISLLVLCSGCGRRGVRAVATGDDVDGRPAPPAPSHGVTATAEGIQATRSFAANLEFDPDLVAVVSAPARGLVERVFATEGDRVRKGDPLAELQSVEAAGARTSWSARRAQLALGHEDLARAQRLLGVGAGSERELEQSLAGVGRARAAEAHAATLVRMLGGGGNLRLTSVTLTAPISGTVVRRSLFPGEHVNANDQKVLFMLADTSRLLVMLDAPEAELGRLKLGTAVEVSVFAYPDRVFRGSIEATAAALKRRSRTLPARVSLNNEQGLLKANMAANVTLLERPVSDQE